MIISRAPGKLFVAGEYAVLEPGLPAVLVAVDRYATVTVTEAAHDTTMASDSAGGTVIHCVRHEDRVVPVADGASTHFGYLLAAATVVERLARHCCHRTRPFELITTGDGFTESDGRKLGLGSSAAVTVAAVAALAEFYGLRLTTADRYRLAMLATLAVDPRGSGGDVAASTWGGWIAYRSPDRRRVSELVAAGGVAAALREPWPGLSVTPLPSPNRIRLLAGWTGQPSSTPALTARLQDRRPAREHAAFLADSTTCVQRLIAGIRDDDAAAVQDEIRTARVLLETLDRAYGLGIRTPRLDALCATADLVGAAAKPSGAGGGDCGIAVVGSEHPHRIEELAARWIEAGIRPIPFEIRRSV